MRVKALSFPAVASLFAVAAAVSPPACAAYPEDNKIIEFTNHSSPGGGAGLFVLTCADLLNKTGIVKQKIQVQHRQRGGDEGICPGVQRRAAEGREIHGGKQIRAVLAGCNAKVSIFN